MIGLVAKDFIVFKKICKPAYRLLGIILLLCACIFIPQAAIPYFTTAPADGRCFSDRVG